MLITMHIPASYYKLIYVYIEYGVYMYHIKIGCALRSYMKYNILT